MSTRAWLLATRPKTLTAAFVPILAGTLLAKTVNHLTLCVFIVALFIQVGTNLINDALDFKRGADTSKRIGPVRVTQMGLLAMQQVLAGGVACFFLALLFSIPLIVHGGTPLMLIILLSILSGYLYTGGPMPLAYSGLGDVFVILFFGWISTGVVYYLQTGEVSAASIIAGTQIGLLATVLLAINNLRDVEQDFIAKKRTVAVRFGNKIARLEITLCALTPFLLNFYWFRHGYIFSALLPWFVFPLALKLISNIWNTEPSPVYNQYLAQSALLHLAFGVLISLGFWLQ